VWSIGAQNWIVNFLDAVCGRPHKKSEFSINLHLTRGLPDPFGREIVFDSLEMLCTVDAHFACGSAV
jgi:hypothetical protein